MKRILVTLAFSLAFVFNIVAQDFCGTPAITNIENVKKLSSPQKRSANTFYTLRIYFHVIRSSSGTGGVSISNVESAYSRLNNDFNSHGIYFFWDGIIDYIDSDSYYNNVPNTNIFNVNNHVNGIDIYLFPSSTNCSFSGKANGVGMNSEYLVVGNISGTPACVTSTVSHEMGHVLNLWHTHHGTYNEGGNDNPCPELVNGSNSSTCGDYVEDTPADPMLNGNVNGNCVYTGTGTDANNQAYNPDVDLIMSYAPKSCRIRFSTKQGERMRDAIENLPYLMHTQYHTLSGPSTICTDSTVTYVINDLPSGYTVNWSIDNSNFSISPSSNQCFVEYYGLPQYDVTNLTATISWQGTTIKTLSKRIVMHGALYVTGWQYGNLFTPNGTYPDREFTIPANNGLLLSRSKPERLSIDDIFAKDKESLPINFTEDVSLVSSGITPFDVCGYGITEINGGNMVYLNSTRFDGMDISFSGTHSPSYYYRSGNYIEFEMPYNGVEYYTKLHAQSDSGCHDFCLMFKVVPLPGAASGDDEIWVNLDGSMLYITFMGGSSGYSVTISKIPSGTQVYSNTFPGNQNSFSVNTSSWASGIYSIRIVQGNNVYTKSIYL